MRKLVGEREQHVLFLAIPTSTRDLEDAYSKRIAE